MLVLSTFPLGRAWYWRRDAAAGSARPCYQPSRVAWIYLQGSAALDPAVGGTQLLKCGAFLLGRCLGGGCWDCRYRLVKGTFCRQSCLYHRQLILNNYSEVPGRELNCAILLLRDGCEEDCRGLLPKLVIQSVFLTTVVDQLKLAIGNARRLAFPQQTSHGRPGMLVSAGPARDKAITKATLTATQITQSEAKA